MATSSFTVQFSEKPYQPDKFNFPKRSYGKKQPVKRAFQPSWFSRWKWLHYEESIDAAFCLKKIRGEKISALRAVTQLLHSLYGQTTPFLLPTPLQNTFIYLHCMY